MNSKLKSKKGQFAMSEVVISSLMITSFIAVASGIVLAYSKTSSVTSPALFYDFFQASYRNATFHECAISPGNSCTGLLPIIARIYGLSYLKISSGLENAFYGLPSSCAHSYYMCAPLKNGSQYSITCIDACGG